MTTSMTTTSAAKTPVAPTQRIITTLTEALDTLFHDRRRIKGIRVDGYNNHTFKFKIYHERRDGSDVHKNTTLNGVTDFEQGLEYAVREGFCRSDDAILREELERDIHLAGIRKYVAHGNSAILRPSIPGIDTPGVLLYEGHNIRQHPLVVMGGPTITATIGMAHVGAINEAIKKRVPYESQVLLGATGEFPVQR